VGGRDVNRRAGGRWRARTQLRRRRKRVTRRSQRCRDKVSGWARRTQRRQRSRGGVGARRIDRCRRPCRGIGLASWVCGSGRGRRWGDQADQEAHERQHMPQASKHTRFPFAQHGAQSPTSEGILRSPAGSTGYSESCAAVAAHAHTGHPQFRDRINGVASGKRMEGPQAHAVQSAANRCAPLSQVVTRASMMGRDSVWNST
jgi:hypothetical protein